MRRHPELGFAMISERFDRRVSPRPSSTTTSGATVAATPSALPDRDPAPLPSRPRRRRLRRHHQPPVLPTGVVGLITPFKRSPSNTGTQFDPSVVEAFMIVSERGKLPLSAAALALEVEAG